MTNDNSFRSPDEGETDNYFAEEFPEEVIDQGEIYYPENEDCLTRLDAELRQETFESLDRNALARLSDIVAVRQLVQVAIYNGGVLAILDALNEHFNVQADMTMSEQLRHSHLEKAKCIKRCIEQFKRLCNEQELPSL